jgi:DNA-binding MarR family transcriptional regulator
MNIRRRHAPRVRTDRAPVLRLSRFHFRSGHDPLEIGFGRAHHRVLHFIDRKPGLTVAELLDLLKITKQSLARVLKQLIDGGYVDQKPRSRGPPPARTLSDRGQALIRSLREPQSRRIVSALEQSGCAEEEIADSCWPW